MNDKLELQARPTKLTISCFQTALTAPFESHNTRHFLITINNGKKKNYYKEQIITPVLHLWEGVVTHLPTAYPLVILSAVHSFSTQHLNAQGLWRRAKLEVPDSLTQQRGKSLPRKHFIFMMKVMVDGCQTDI